MEARRLKIIIAATLAMVAFVSLCEAKAHECADAKITRWCAVKKHHCREGKNWHDLPKWEQFYRQCASAKEADALAECYADDARLWAHATDGQLHEHHRHPDICELMYGK